MFIPTEQPPPFSLLVLAHVNLTDPDNPLESRQIPVNGKAPGSYGSLSTTCLA